MVQSKGLPSSVYRQRDLPEGAVKLPRSLA